ncbi:MAG: high-affinity branched-chain amino acid transporter rane protein, partial [Burkholderiales bacterium]|nr:high-affinity branched-chain amino acid transporter rane protein [Burkholderiales bacterium]
MKNAGWGIVLAAVVAVLAALPWIGTTVMVQFGINVLLLATVAQGWNIIGGYTGYPSFGNSVFYGLGAYGVAIAMVQFAL